MPLIAHKPSQYLVDLVHALGGQWHGRVAMCRCPAHDDHDPSLSIRQGDRGILVTCFAGCTRENVLRELGRIPLVARATPPPEIPGAGSGNAVRLWREAEDVRGTLAERYLVLRHFHDIPPDLRFHPRCPYLPKPRTQFLPALLVAVREGRRLVAIQRIFLDRQTGVCAVKVMLGRPGKGAWQGGVPTSTLAIAEGFETARAYTLIHGIPCWASLGARRLDHLRLPEHVQTLLIAHDNDAEGRGAADRAAQHYRVPGLQIARDSPPAAFNDWADMFCSSLKPRTPAT